MITVHSLADNPQRWPDYLFVADECKSAGLPEPIEECITLGPPREGWRDCLAIDILAAYLHNGHAIITIDGVTYDLDDAIKAIRERRDHATGDRGHTVSSDDIDGR